MAASVAFFSAPRFEITPILCSEQGRCMLVPPSGLRDIGLDDIPQSYPSPRTSLDTRHRDALARVLRDGISEQELSESAEYLRGVREWARQVEAQNPDETAAARENLGYATSYSAAVQEGFGNARVNQAIRQVDAAPIADLLRRNFDDMAVASSLNFGGRGLNSVIRVMEAPDRRNMAAVLSRVPRLGALDSVSIEQLRSTLSVRSPEALGFNQRYPLMRSPFTGTTIV